MSGPAWHDDDTRRKVTALVVEVEASDGAVGFAVVDRGGAAA